MYIDDRIFFWIAAGLYSVSFIVALITLPTRHSVARVAFHSILIGGFVFQGLGLYLRGISVQAFPLMNEFEVLQVLGWSAVLLDLIIRPLFKLRLLSFFTAALAAGLCIISLLVPGWDYPPETIGAGSPWMGFHAALAIFSYGVFALLAVTSLMYLIQHHGLETKRSGGIFSLLPAIRQLEDINSRLILLGVSILSVGVVIGFLNWLTFPATVSVAKLWIACSIWGAYMVVLILRLNQRLFASRFAGACLALFLLALLSLWPLVPGKKTQPTPAGEPPIENHGTP